MRWVGAVVAVLPALVIFLGVLGNAETPRKHSLIEQLGLKTLVGWPPNGPDVLRELHQLSMVETRLAKLAAARDDTVRRFANDQAEQAQRRDARTIGGHEIGEALEAVAHRLVVVVRLIDQNARPLPCGIRGLGHGDDVVAGADDGLGGDRGRGRDDAPS